MKQADSPQRRRGAEISAEKTSTIPKRVAAPPASHAGLACASCVFFSALASASLRLCGEVLFFEMEANPR
jgi:hypothetical protein